MSKNLGQLGFLLAILFFLIIIFLPAVFVLKFAFGEQVQYSGEILKSIIRSFEVGLIVLVIDLIVGIPLAWYLARSKSHISRIIDVLIDFSLIVPTAALGFSVLLYWVSPSGVAFLFGQGELVSTGAVLMILLHLTFTMPYVVRSVMAAIKQIEPEMEEAATVLGALPFTIFRTISMPLFRDGVIVGAVLAFTRSLSETGATMIVAGSFSTASVLIVGYKNTGLLAQAAGASIVLILTAVVVLFISKLLLAKKQFAFHVVCPRLENKIYKLKKSLVLFFLLFFILIIFLPTIYIVLFNIFNFTPLFNSDIVKSLIISFAVAGLITIASLFVSVPIGYIIARNRFRMGKFLDTLNEMIVIVPTSALGLSLVLFWRHFLNNDFMILFLTHLSFSFPLFLKPVTAGFMGISESIEEAAFTLGANVRKMFVSILLPQIRPALFAGGIMAFMRSLSETGATMAVSKEIKTIPIIIVDLVKSGKNSEAAFVSSVLFVLTIMFLIALKRINKM